MGTWTLADMEAGREDPFSPPPSAEISSTLSSSRLGSEPQWGGPASETGTEQNPERREEAGSNMSACLPSPPPPPLARPVQLLQHRQPGRLAAAAAATQKQVGTARWSSALLSCPPSDVRALPLRPASTLPLRNHTERSHSLVIDTAGRRRALTS